MEATYPEKIAKERIPFLQFMNEDVISDPQIQKLRRDNLARACMLGNSYKGKVKIHFQTTDGPKSVYTTIWGLTEDYVGLKNGTTIPVRSVYEVKL